MTKNKPTLLAALFLTATLTSCDPGQILVIENKSMAPVTVEFVFSDPRGYYDLDESSDLDTLSLVLEAPPGNAVKEYGFGIGTWEINHAVDTLSSTIESIAIDSWKSKEIFTGPVQIQAFFKSRVTGRYKERIEIVIE